VSDGALPSKDPDEASTMPPLTGASSVGRYP
jgi:hypothetical protein